VIALIAVPLILQSYGIFAIGYVARRRCGCRTRSRRRPA
jgi:ACR3 family arsenite efflux pump ArsB